MLLEEFGKGAASPSLEKRGDLTLSLKCGLWDGN